MSSRHYGRIYLLAVLFTVVTGIGGCDGEAVIGAMGAVQGTVVGPDREALTSTLLTVDGTSYSALTNVEGRYVMNMPAGNYSITAVKEGYRPLSLPITIAGGSGDGRLDFTLATEQGSSPVRLALSADSERYPTGRPVELRLQVTNGGLQPVELRSYGFFVQDGMGNVLWRHEAAAGNEVGPETSTVFGGRWAWYDDCTTTIMLGGTIACYGFVRLGDDPEKISAPTPVVLEAPVAEPTVIPFDSLEAGNDSAFAERLALVIASDEDWRDFYSHHAPNRRPPAVDFTKSCVIAALGGRCATAAARVTVSSVERLPLYRPIAGDAAICVAERYRCRIDKVLRTQDSAADVVTSPYHLIVLPQLHGTVDFVWDITGR